MSEGKGPKCWQHTGVNEERTGSLVSKTTLTPKKEQMEASGTFDKALNVSRLMDIIQRHEHIKSQKTLVIYIHTHIYTGTYKKNNHGREL